MSKIDEIIAELCPDGVGFIPIKDCVKKTENIKWSENKDTEYQYIDLTSVDRVTQKIAETQTINAENAPSRAQQIVQSGDVLFGTTRPTLKRFCLIGEEFNNQICSTGFCVLRANESIALQKWIYYQIASTDFFAYVERYQKGASYPAISDFEVKNFKIPLPPLTVQREIVRILDNFTELTVELTVELTAELTARKKQYEYYLDQMMEQNQFERRSLNEVGIMKRGTYVTKESTRPGSIPVILGGQQPAYYCDTCNHEGEAIVISRSGAYAGFVSFWDEPIFVTDGFIIETKGELLLKFIYYYLKSIQEVLHQSKRGGGVPHVRGTELMKIQIPVPSIAEQGRIVYILDRFDALVNDISSGLPAEIEARRKQYEYYRDQLLTFKEAKA